MVEWLMVLAGSDSNGDLVRMVDRRVIPCQRKDSGWRRAVWDIQIQAFSHSLDFVYPYGANFRRLKMAPLQLRNLCNQNHFLSYEQKAESCI